MQSKVGAAMRILQNEGPLILGAKIPLYLAKKTSYGDNHQYQKTLTDIIERMIEEESLDDILDTVLDIKPGYHPYNVSVLQLRDEIEELANLVKREDPQTILEIGTAHGGSFYIWSRYLKNSIKLISLDLPAGEFGGGYNERKTNVFRAFAPSKEMEFVRKNSHDSETFSEVSELIDDGVDFLFIDGDHTYDGVKQDFEMYSKLVSDGGIIALHDIVNHPSKQEVVQKRGREIDDIEERHLNWDESHPYCNVDQYWAELVEEYETEEIVSHPKQTWGGIGVVRLN